MPAAPPVVLFEARLEACTYAPGFMLVGEAHWQRQHDLTDIQRQQLAVVLSQGLGDLVRDNAWRTDPNAPDLKRLAEEARRAPIIVAPKIETPRTVNQVREEIGLAPLPDDVPWGRAPLDPNMFRIWLCQQAARVSP